MTEWLVELGPFELGMRGPQASAAFRLAAKACVMHADVPLFVLLAGAGAEVEVDVGTGVMLDGL